MREKGGEKMGTGRGRDERRSERREGRRCMGRRGRQERAEHDLMVEWKAKEHIKGTAQ